MEKIMIFDTTLRDGEQSAGCQLSMSQKMKIARRLEALGVDVIEVGFPANSETEFLTAKNIAKNVRKPVICALSHANESAIKKTCQAIKNAARSRIHVFISASDIHLKHQLKKTRQEVIEIVKNSVSLAKNYLPDVEFSPMDATRADPEYLYQIIRAAISCGAKTINIPDTVGYALPDEFGKMVSGIFENVPEMQKSVLSVHCHNDFGLAVANSLAGLSAGARQVEVTVNGLGERAGNCSLEEIVMALKIRQDFFGFFTGIDSREIYKTSRLVSHLTGFLVQPNKAIVGANAFAHASGIHQDGVLKEPLTYEIMKPADVGQKESRIVMGKLSGRHAFEKKSQELGFSLSGGDLNQAFSIFKEIAEKKKTVSNGELIAIFKKFQR